MSGVKQAFARFAVQLGVSLIEHEIRRRLTERGINPDEFEQMLKGFIDAANHRSPSLKVGFNTTQAFRELGLQHNATPQEIKTRFRVLVLENHSDRTQDPKTEKKLRSVIEAFNTLKKAGLAK